MEKEKEKKKKKKKVKEESIIGDPEEEEEELLEKYTKSINITTPFISVAIVSDDKCDDVEGLKKIAEHIMDKYKNHHLIRGDDTYWNVLSVDQEVQ